MWTLLAIIHVAIGFFNILLVGHEYAGMTINERERAVATGDTMGKVIMAILLAPYFLVFMIGYRVKNFPKIRVTFTKNGDSK